MNGPNGIELARLEVRDLPGVFAARQAGRELADGLGLERQDQVRVATALSEVSRSVVSAGLTAVVAFGTDQGDLVLTVSVSGDPPGAGTDAAARLMDAVEVSGSVIWMTKRMLAPRPRPGPGHGSADTEALRRRLASLLPQTTMEELRRDNEDLIAALEELRRQKEQLLLLNAELQETNRGVMALYNELSAELEQTNRGVVALYAELEEKSERLRAASESKDRFWANVSHELRTPLNSILGLTRILTDPVYGSLDEEQAHQVGLIRDSTSTMLALVNDLLDVAKAESGSFSLEPAHVRLPALLASLRALVRPMAEGKPVDVVLPGDGVPATVLTDELALTAILRNLLSNAIRYTDSGEVRLTVTEATTESATGGLLEISVSDTGPGIPPGQQERVFEEFYRVPGTRQRGTGLGLPYARRLAELLGGDLTLTSTLGEGTAVTLRLPGGMPSVGSVVVADDDPAFRQVLRAMLDGIAGRVTEAENGAQALAAVSDSAADLLLTDVRMPGTDGISLLAQLADSIPAIVVTGTDAPRPAGAAALLHKENLTAERLAFTIRAIMEEST
jgi:signal transduction histidine kinase/CheY-like chemotaxis protein